MSWTSLVGSLERVLCIDLDNDQGVVSGHNEQKSA